MVSNVLVTSQRIYLLGSYFTEASLSLVLLHLVVRGVTWLSEVEHMVEVVCWAGFAGHTESDWQQGRIPPAPDPGELSCSDIQEIPRPFN